MSKAKRDILLGVTGSIAAYKACDIVRELLRRKMDVKVVLTSEAEKFVSSITFEALSRNKVATDIFSPCPYGPAPHCYLAQESDILLVAPATANIIAKFAHGLADDLLSAIFIATKKPVVIAPAMHPDMYSNPSVQENIKKLKGRGVLFVDPIESEVACGQYGKGHLAPIEMICDKIDELINIRESLQGISFLITAGPTREFIDPVRFISNRSSGKMGFALAMAAKARGADVTLISGPTTLLPPSGIDFIPVVSAKDMLKATEDVFPETDVVIMTAAVTDFRPSETKKTKIKKDINGVKKSLSLKENVDILAQLGKKKKKNQLLVGFAAEDTDIIENAKKKLVSKNLDIIVANEISVPGSGFEADLIKGTILRPGLLHSPLILQSKAEIAEKILDEIENILHAK